LFCAHREEHESKKAKTEDSTVSNGSEASQQHADPNAYNYSQWGNYGVCRKSPEKFYRVMEALARLLSTAV
jgi:hypothetical protein